MQEPFWTRRSIVFLAAFAACFLWGSASPCIKIGYSLFQIGADDTPSRILFAGLRFFLAGWMVVLYESIRNHSFSLPKKGNWPMVLKLMCFQTIGQYIFFYMGLAHTSGVRGSIINASGTFFTIFLSAFVFRFEKLTVRKVVGSLIGFAGVMCVIADQSAFTGELRLDGEGAMVIAAISSSIAGNLIKRYGQKEDPAILSGWQFLLGGAVMILIGLISGGHLHPVSFSAWILLAYMAFISAGAYTLWSILLRYNDVSRISILGFMNPVLGVLLSAVFLKEGEEAFTLSTMLAIILVTLGIFISDSKKHSRKNA